MPPQSVLPQTTCYFPHNIHDCCVRRWCMYIWVPVPRRQDMRHILCLSLSGSHKDFRHATWDSWGLYRRYGWIRRLLPRIPWLFSMVRILRPWSCLLPQLICDMIITPLFLDFNSKYLIFLDFCWIIPVYLLYYQYEMQSSFGPLRPYGGFGIYG